MLYRVCMAAALLGGVATAAEPLQVLIAYHSKTGNTEKLARALAEGAASVEGASSLLRKVADVTKEDLESADAVALGSPVYMGDVAPEFRAAAVRWAGEYGLWDSRGLRDKPGAVFATGAFPSNGKEFTMISLAQTLLQFGMVLVSPYGSFGASATTYRPDEGVDEVELKIARDLGVRLAETALRLGPPPAPAARQEAKADGSPVCPARGGDVGHCRTTLPLGPSARVAAYSNYPLDRPNETVLSAAVVVHGAGRNANDYFRYASESAAAAGRLKDTLIVAPEFGAESDDAESWGSDWREGGRSKGARVSTYAVIDRLFEIVRERFPNVRRVVISGHSAGGQFVHRYAAAGRGPDLVPQLETSFLVMNPSSYLYVDVRRFHEGRFQTLPEDRNECPSFNEWKYGLEKLNDYAEASGAEKMTAVLARREVIYLGGERDVRTDNSLDRSCAALLQGSNRLTRWSIYEQYVEQSGNERWKTHSRFATVPGVGHSGREMYASPQAQAVLFHRP